MAGRPRFVPTDDQRVLVAAMRERDFTLEAIANRIGVSLPTLRKAFQFELMMHNPAMHRALGVQLVKKALAGNFTAFRILDKQYQILKPHKMPVAPVRRQDGAPMSVEEYVAGMRGLRPEQKRFFLDNMFWKDGAFHYIFRLNLGSPEIAARIEEGERRRVEEERAEAARLGLPYIEPPTEFVVFSNIREVGTSA